MITQEQNRLMAYLMYTDWYVIRKMETGVDIPAEILAARAAARVRLSEIKQEQE